MLTFKKSNKKIARINGGEYDGKILYLHNPDYKCCSKCSDSCKESRKKCCDKCSKKITGGCGSCYSKIKNRDIFDSVKVDNGTIIPLPNDNDEEADHYYVAGQTGAGKSSFVGNILSEFPEKKKKDIFVFSTFDDDKALDDLNPSRILIDDDMINDPIQKEELKNSLVVFDDIDKITPTRLANACRSLRDDLLQNGRKMGIKVFTTSHQIMNHKQTRDSLACTQKIIIFPQATSPYHVERFLRVYMGLDKKQVRYIMNLNTRWILFSTNHPRYMLWENGCMILNKICDESKREKYDYDNVSDAESTDSSNDDSEEQISKYIRKIIKKRVKK